jgi:hypothetical protein
MIKVTCLTPFFVTGSNFPVFAFMIELKIFLQEAVFLFS